MSLGQLLEDLIKRTWEQADTTAIPAMIAPRASIRGLEDSVHHGPEEFALFHKMIIDQFRDIKITVLNRIEQDDWVAMSFSVRATERLEGRRINTVGHVLSRFEDGRVIEGHNFLDMMTLFEQAGRLPPRALDHCLLGGKMTTISETRQRACH